MDRGIGKTECDKITQDNSEKAVAVAADSGYGSHFICICDVIKCHHQIIGS